MKKNKVHFLFHDVKVTLSNRSILKMFIEDLFKREGKQLNSLQYIFCSDEYLLGLNQSFLKHDTLTDIITFNLSTTQLIEGEIYISVDRVAENAGLFTTSRSNELLRVIFHGALHLCGYKDKRKGDIVKMRAMEDNCLNRFRQKVSRETHK